ncbi:major capsid protein [Vibrio campbellii]
MNKLKTIGLTSLVLLSGSAFAEVPASVTTAIDGLQTDGALMITAAGTCLITLAAIAVGFRWTKGTLFS